jgi:hypothetical protein
MRGALGGFQQNSINGIEIVGIVENLEPWYSPIERVFQVRTLSNDMPYYALG